MGGPYFERSRDDDGAVPGGGRDRRAARVLVADIVVERPVGVDFNRAIRSRAVPWPLPGPWTAPARSLARLGTPVVRSFIALSDRMVSTERGGAAGNGI